MTANPIYMASNDIYTGVNPGVSIQNGLPLGTYNVLFNPQTGYSLQRVEDLSVGSERIYGSRDRQVHKVVKTFRESSRNLGVLITGGKGLGKSLFLRMLSEDLRKDNLPVILVKRQTPGLSDFIESCLPQCMVVFDEFEKNFRDDEGGQDELLSLFDGMSSSKRLYCITANDKENLNDNLLNRPGRFHYHFNFKYPTATEIKTYLSDRADEPFSDNEINQVILLSRFLMLNYDHLRAIVDEKNRFPEDNFADLLEDLNIKADDGNRRGIPVIATFKNCDPISTSIYQDYEGNVVIQGLYDTVNLEHATPDVTVPMSSIEIEGDELSFSTDDYLSLISRDDQKKSLKEKELISIKTTSKEAYSLSSFSKDASSGAARRRVVVARRGRRTRDIEDSMADWEKELLEEVEKSNSKYSRDKN